MTCERCNMLGKRVVTNYGNTGLITNIAISGAMMLVVEYPVEDEVKGPISYIILAKDIKEIL